MQKDIHFYLTYFLAAKIGIPTNDAEKIAWANQYTDELTEADLHGIQTQSSILGNWSDKQVQLSVLVPFHFVPGPDSDPPWVTTPNNAYAQELVELASEDLFQLGIALHGLQDTFSHEGFSGWQEDVNSCFPWYYIESAIPSVGHAEMRVIPDVVNYVWTDPRSGEEIDNKKRAMSAAKATYDFLVKFFNSNIDQGVWLDLQGELQQAFNIELYDDRKQRFRDLSASPTIRCSRLSEEFKELHKKDFIMAASNHLANAMNLFQDLPWGA